MVEAVLRSQDCLRDNLLSPALICLSRRTHHGGDNRKFNPNPCRSLKKVSRPNHFSRKIDDRSEMERDVVVVKEQKRDLLMEQVRILKRGEVIPHLSVKGKMEAEVDVVEVSKTPVAVKMLSKRAAAKMLSKRAAAKMLSKRAAAKMLSKKDVTEDMVPVDQSTSMRSSKGAKDDVETEPRFFAGEDDIPQTPVAVKKMLSKQVQSRRLWKEVPAKTRSNKGVKEVMIDEMCRGLDFVMSTEPEQEVFRKIGEDEIPQTPVEAKSKRVTTKTRSNKGVKEVPIKDFVELVGQEREVFRKMIETQPTLFAGAMFVSSPCPSSLPKPSFSFLKKDGSRDLATKTAKAFSTLKLPDSVRL